MKPYITIIVSGKRLHIDDEDYFMFYRNSATKWNVSSAGYVQRYNKDKKTGNELLHRLIVRASPRQRVDHINRNPLDNRKSNLRFCTYSQNASNVGKLKNNTSGFRGVCWQKKSQKWMASLRINGTIKYLGIFSDINEAALAYDKASKARSGEFAHQNFPN